MTWLELPALAARNSATLVADKAARRKLFERALSLAETLGCFHFQDLLLPLIASTRGAAPTPVVRYGTRVLLVLPKASG